MPHRADRSELKPAQRLALAALNGGETEELTRGQYEQLTGVSRSQAAYDLAELVEGGVVERIGGGRTTRYRLARKSHPSQRHWTNERIRAALVEFCAGRKTWPSAGDFKTAGHTDLYVAASRYGGVGFWAAELGFSQPGRVAPRQRLRRPIAALIRPAAAGVAFAAVVLGVAGAVLYPRHGAPARKATGPHPATEPHPAHATASRRYASPQRQSHVRLARARSSPSIRRERRSGSELAVRTIRTSGPASVPRQTQARPAASSAGPAPLPAPPGGGTGPAPLPSP